MKNNSLLLTLFLLLIFSCSSSSDKVIEANNCELLFQKLHNQQKISNKNLGVDKHLDSLLLEVSIGEEIMNSKCYNLLDEVEFETYEFGEVDGMILYKNLVCNLGFILTNYRNWAFGRAQDTVLDENKHCSIGEEFFLSNKN